MGNARFERWFFDASSRPRTVGKQLQERIGGGLQTLSNPSAWANSSTNSLLFLWPGTNRFSTVVLVLQVDRDLPDASGARRALGSLRAENLLRYYSMPAGSKPATLVAIDIAWSHDHNLMTN